MQREGRIKYALSKFLLKIQKIFKNKSASRKICETFIDSGKELKSRFSNSQEVKIHIIFFVWLRIPEPYRSSKACGDSPETRAQDECRSRAFLRKLQTDKRV